MPNLNDMIQRATEKTKKPGNVQGASVIENVQRVVMHRDDNDSPTALFLPEVVEETALLSVQRLINLWDSQKEEREQKLGSPEEYIEEANRLFTSYKGLRIKIDSAVAYSIGDTLNSCKEKFFKDGSNGNMNWTQFIQSKISFSLRIAYDFMNISKHLSGLKGKKMSMEQFRAALSVVSSGIALDELAGRIEQMSPKEILSLKAPREQRIERSPQQIIVGLKVLLVKAEDQVKEFTKGIKGRNSMLGKHNLAEKEKAEVRVLQLRLQSILSSLDEHLR